MSVTNNTNTNNYQSMETFVSRAHAKVLAKAAAAILAKATNADPATILDTLSEATSSSSGQNGPVNPSTGEDTSSLNIRSPPLDDSATKKRASSSRKEGGANGIIAPRPKKVCHGRECSVANCTNPIFRRGLCYRHGACSHDGCRRRAKWGGVCARHGAEEMRLKATGYNHAKRSLNCYNIFFIFERELLIQSRGGSTPQRPEPLMPVGEHNELPPLPTLPLRFCNINMTDDWYLPSWAKKKRKHCKTHGLIKFGEMAKLIANNWKTIDDETKGWCLAVEKVSYIGWYPYLRR